MSIDGKKMYVISVAIIVVGLLGWLEVIDGKAVEGLLIMLLGAEGYAFRSALKKIE